MILALLDSSIIGSRLSAHALNLRDQHHGDAESGEDTYISESIRPATSDSCRDLQLGSSSRGDALSMPPRRTCGSLRR